MKSKPIKDQFRPRVAIIGAGISGLSSAYAMVKLGYDVSLISSKERQSSTFHQHGWFHSGSLYALNKNPQVIAHFQQNMSLLNFLGGDFDVKNEHCGWFEDWEISYHVRNHRNRCLRLFSPWSHKIRQALMRQQGLYAPGFLATSLSYKTNTFQPSFLGKNYFKYVSADRVMKSEMIVRSFHGFLSKSGIKHQELVVEKLESMNNQVLVNGAENFDLVIVCAGADIQSLTGVETKTVYSLIGVTNNQAMDSSFVVIEKDPRLSINCMNHCVGNGKKISVFGDGLNFDAKPSSKDRKAFREKISKLSGSQPDYVYVGSKTEILNVGDDRNYRPSFVESSPNIVACTPGKFTNFPSIINKLVTRFPRNVECCHESDWSPIYLERYHEKF